MTIPMSTIMNAGVDSALYLYAAIIGVFGLVIRFILPCCVTGPPKKDAMQSIAVGRALPGEGQPRRLKQYADELLANPIGASHVKTAADTFDHGLSLNPNGDCLGTRVILPDGKLGDYEWQSYTEINTRMTNFGAGLRKLGAQPGQNIGFYSKNRAEWQIGAIACNHHSMVTVALYDTLGEESREYIINHAEIKVILFTSDLAGNIKKLLPACPHLKTLIVIDDGDCSVLADSGVMTFKQVEKLGEDHPIDFSRPSPSDAAIIMYTSGTTGVPKGVVVEHKNIAAACAANSASIPKLEFDDIYFSYLPLAHIFERVCDECIFMMGAKIGYFGGDVRKIAEDIALLKPSCMAGVPKVFDRFVAVVRQKVGQGSRLKQFLFKTAYNAKKKAIAAGQDTPFWNRLIFNKTKAALGGKMRGMVTGAAPCSAETMEFIRIVFCVNIQQGFSMTESTCTGAVTDYDMIHPAGKVGAPTACMEIKLVDTPDGRYSSSHNPPTGEVCLHGPAVTRGYYKEAKKTAETYKVDGNGKRFLHTGDVGRWNEDGTLSIIGRVKDIFKLSQGEYIAPERVETVIMGTKYIAQAFVHGDSTRDYLVACVVPDAPELIALADRLGIEYHDKPAGPAPDCPKDLCSNPRIQQEIEDDLAIAYKKAKLTGLEKPKKIHYSPHFWMPGDLMTPTFKNKRPQLFEHFTFHIENMYSGGGAE